MLKTTQGTKMMYVLQWPTAINNDIHESYLAKQKNDIDWGVLLAFSLSSLSSIEMP